MEMLHWHRKQKVGYHVTPNNPLDRFVNQQRSKLVTTSVWLVVCPASAPVGNVQIERKRPRLLDLCEDGKARTLITVPSFHCDPTYHQEHRSTSIMNRPMARRQTLGPVSVNVGAENAGHRRQSVGPSSVPPKARPPTGRASMIPRAGRENLIPPTPPSTNPRRDSIARRSSVGGDRGQPQPLPPLTVPAKTDPRQVTDKVFQQQCIKKLLKYLVDHGYDHPITHKSLARPSGKDFNHIVTFLFRQVDPNFQDGTMKIEDEVAMNFKALGYPFPVSKTSLVAAGSPHAWPSLLAAVTWLTERIQLMLPVTPDPLNSENFESLEELEVKTDKAFFRYLSASYTAFLQGDEHATEELELDLAEQFEKDDVIIEREIEQMTDKNAVIVEQINNMAMGKNE